jgi:hypothetical protein
MCFNAKIDGRDRVIRISGLAKRESAVEAQIFAPRRE